MLGHPGTVFDERTGEPIAVVLHEEERVVPDIQLSRDMQERRLFDTAGEAMLDGLKARAAVVENSSAQQRILQVYDAFKPYGIEGKELPPGTTPQIMRFLVVSAGVPGLWHRMDEDNQRLGDCLLGYYGEGLSTVELAERVAGVTNPGSVGQFLERGLRWLWANLPEISEEFPIDKHVVFPLNELQATRKERRRAASTEWARKHRFHERGREFALRRWGAKTHE